MKDYKDRNNFILRTFEKASFSCQNAFKKCTRKTEPCNSKCYIKKLPTRL